MSRWSIQDTTERYRGGEMMCAVCGFVICTLYEPVEGVEPRSK